MSRQKYSDRDKATALAALDANNGNVYKTAKQLGISRSTLQEWARGRVNKDVPELRQEEKKNLADRLEEVAHQILDELPKHLGEATAQQLATSLGIIVDKRQLLTNKPTDRVVVTDDLTDEQRAARLMAIVERARQRAAGGTPPEDGHDVGGS